MLGEAAKQEILQQTFQKFRSQIVFRTDIFRKLTLGACLRPPQNVKLDIFKSLACSDGKVMYKKA